jgi:phosphoglycerate dehydrogenase-like enzyme
MEVFIGRCNPDQIKNAKKLIWLQHSSHGVDDCLSPETQRMEFILTNAQHTSGPPIAEHAIALMMMMGRGIHRLHLAQMEHDWIRRSIDFPIIEIKGKTMLVVGLGGIGTEIAERAYALGMRILATRNSSRNGPDFVEYVGLSHEVYDLAKQSDVIVNALPLTGETENMFNKKLFDSVKRGAYYISIGRGETTVNSDLIDALKDGRLTAAGLDVTDPEPLPPDNELWTLPNVIITPHVAADTDQGRWRRWLVVRENLRRYINGDKLLNVVNKELGY